MPETLNRARDIGEANREDPRVKKVLKTIDSYQRKPDALIQVLHAVQDIYGYVPLKVLSLVAKEMKVPPSRIFGVVTFYHYFSLRPKGDHTCQVCTGTACYVKGAQKIIDQIEREFGIKPGQTTPNKKLGLQTVRCIGACGMAPAVVVDNEILAKVDAAAVGDLLRNRIGTTK